MCLCVCVGGWGGKDRSKARAVVQGGSMIVLERWELSQRNLVCKL